MNSTKHYTISELKKRVPLFIAILLLAGMITLNVAVPEPVTKPDAEYPIANAAINWDQTYASGAWSGAE